MDSALVNWEALDALVLDFVRSDQLVVLNPSSSSSSPPLSPSSTSTASSSSTSSGSYRSRILIRCVRRYLEAGDVDSVLSLLRAQAPSVLDDHRLLFKLQKQKFVELLRSGSESDRDLAMECLRTTLAPCALDAYPEAYEEFKHILLALIYDKDDQLSPIVNEWSVNKRSDLAGLLSSVLRSHLHAYDPLFSLTLRYLISIHKVFCMRQGVSSPISDLTERLLLEDRDPAVISQENSLEAAPFDEVDIQALAHAVELTRQASVDSLKFAKGDLLLAFQNELCRMKVDLSVLDNLVHEYCLYRGIIEGTVNLENAKNSNVDRERVDVHEFSGNEDCSTSDVIHQEPFNRRLRKSRDEGAEQRRRKRWRGRTAMIDHDHEVCIPETSHQSGLLSSVINLTEDGSRTSSLAYANAVEDPKYEIVWEMRELAYKGMTAQVVDDINGLDPDFFAQNPNLLFQLKQVEFLKLVSAGDSCAAVGVACRHLGPLATSNQALVKPLKETLVTLLQPAEDALKKAVPLTVLANTLQVAMSRKLGLEEPTLMKIMRATLHTHTEWFKLQMCKDRFEQFLKIDSLKNVDVIVQSDIISPKMAIDECGNSNSQITTCSSTNVWQEGVNAQLSSVDFSDESAILKVMEFLALPRSDAIQLLMQYNGNAETVIQNIFS